MFDNQSSLWQNLPWIRLYDCHFSLPIIEFKLSGLMSLIRCEIKGNRGVILILEKSQYEPDITEETLRYFK